MENSQSVFLHSWGQVCVKYYKWNVGWTMKSRNRFLVFTLTVVLALCTAVQAAGSTGTNEKQTVSSIVQMIPAAVDMKETDGPGNLYALSAVLMDGDSGRVLYEKEGYTARPNASTTKVMTCILALENGAGDDYVEVSKNAASQPEIKLNLKEGEQYYLEDLLYSLMLKSHNDTAVAIAEHIGGSVEGFARMMNEKAKEIGCTNTHFVTPNGLDSADAGGIHQTTARDLALIMSYAIKNKTFLHITQTRDYSFSDISGKRQFSVHNANAFLDMTQDAVSGKTGFTGNAGYCYVAACENEGRTFIISLLGCGWPNNKTYKWKDAMKLLEYGKANFHKETYWQEPKLPEIPVSNGIEEETAEDSKSFVTENREKLGDAYVTGEIKITDSDKKKQILLKDGEKVTCHLRLEKNLTAPVKKGQQIGQVTFSLGELVLDNYLVTADRNIVKITYLWCVNKVFHDFFH